MESIENSINFDNIPEWSAEEYFSNEPYAFLYSQRGDTFRHQVLLEKMSKTAKDRGFRVFKKFYAEYCKKQRGGVIADAAGKSNVTEAEDQPLELQCGAWVVDDCGVGMMTGDGEVIACPHPIMPVARLVNVDTGLERIELAYKKLERVPTWKTVQADKSTIASAQKIVSLADSGISVTSESAKALVRYLQDIENRNLDIIPQRRSVGRLGYIDDENFSPYVRGLVFDGDANFKSIFSAVKPKGKFDEWKKVISEVRSHSTAAKIVIAASFASVLVKRLGGLPFFVHLWGAESGTGKTVALMAAASVWADPQVGKYIQTFNSTTVGHERLAGFLNSLPVIIDELQLAKDSHGHVNFDVYKLAEGVGKTRGTKTGGIDFTPTWANCILTSGESPITSNNSGAGVRNRVLEIECTAAMKIIKDGRETANALKKHFGHAGKLFVKALEDHANIDIAKMTYSMAFEILSKEDTTDKQAMAASIVIAADQVASMNGIVDGNALSVEEVREFLRTNHEVDANLRAYEWLCDWVSANAGHFQDGSTSEYTLDTYGLISGGWSKVYIIRSVFRKVLEEAGFSSQALLSWLRYKGLLETRNGSRAYTVGRRINRILTECVGILIPDGETDVGDAENIDNI